MSYHSMTIPDMMHHASESYPGIPDDVMLDAIKAMIGDNVIRVLFTINNENMYSCYTNPNLANRIWKYMIHMGFLATYDDILSAFGNVDCDSVSDALGLLIAKNIISNDDDEFAVSAVERKNIFHDK